MRYDFLTESYETERIKVISAWSMFTDIDLPVRPHPTDMRGRSVHEHMVHQCVSEDIWFRTMLGIDVGAPPLPKEEVRLEFMRQYAGDSEKRLAALRDKDETWWEGRPLVSARTVVLVLAATLGQILIPLASYGAASGDFVVRGWQAEDGLPESTISAVCQTRDGFIWLGTDRKSVV